MIKSKKTTRPLRVTTTMNALEKGRAEKIAKDEGYSSVGDLLRMLVAKHHTERLAVKKKARERAAKRKALVSKSLRVSATSLPAVKSGNPLALRNSRSGTSKAPTSKSARSKTASSTAKNGTTRRPTKKPRNRGVVLVAPGNASRSTNKRSSARTPSNG